MDATEPLVYVKSEVEGEEWRDARVVARSDDGTVTLETLESKETLTQPADSLLLANTLTGDGVEDMTRLNYLHEPALLANLKHRFERDHVYTYTGKICIAVNPFNWQVSKPLYEEAVLVRYLRRRPGELPPHLYAIAEEAYHRIREGASGHGGQSGLTSGSGNQSILVSGESGAGKTESVKIMMQYLATVSKSGDHNRVARQVLATNPLLEAFGNARTLRNDNSSRFGKFIEIQFDSARRMCGARIHIYLLEKTRVIGQAKGERNFHVFYQLLRGLTSDERSACHLALPLEALRLVGRSGCADIPGLDDGAQLMRTRNAMDAVALSAAEQEQAVRALAAVLLLGQIELEQGADEQAAVGAGSGPLLEHAAELLGIDAGALSHALCTRRLVTRDDEVTVPLNREQADDSRDALAKAVYGKLFGWLVERCNGTLSDERAACSFIGILDIFGFEHFAVNSFEQLCINYANERLQQQFNWDIFKAEQAEYAAEGIEWAGIAFVDNQSCLDLLDKKESMGLLHLLDEECALQRGSDDKFAQKARERHAGHPDFEAPKRDQLAFAVRHYAGAVTYTCADFRDKNKDTLHTDLHALMQTSGAALVLALFPADGPPAPGRKGKPADRMTTGSQFMTQLASLMRTINATDVHYVRCVKPNTLSRPALFDLPHVAHQLRCAGVLEAVRISRMAFPNRMPHAAFVQRYGLLLGREWQAAHARQMAEARLSPHGDEAARALCAAALAAAVDEPARYQLGKSKVFFKAFLLEALEQRRGTALARHAVRVQAALRAALWSRRFGRIKGAAVRLQAGGRARAARSLFLRQRAAAITIGAAARGLSARRLRRRLGAIVRVQAGSRALLARRKTVRLRRSQAATRLQAAARRHARDARFGATRRGAVRLQSVWRMVWQRRLYVRELAESREEAKLSTQLARLQAQLQAEIQARQAAEGEQERLRTQQREAGGPVLEAVRLEKVEGGAARSEEVEGGAALAAEPSQPGTIRSRLAGAAATYLLSSRGGSSTMEETSSMLSLVTKDRERLGQRLAAEQEARRRAEAEKRELERRLQMGSASSQVETRKGRGTAEALARKKEEVAEMRSMMQHQTLEIGSLQAAKAALDRRLLSLEKKLSQYDDAFYALEARNVRDKTRMEEMAKAKNRAEEERGVYRLMLEQAHERWLKERHELRVQVGERLERASARLQEQRTRLAELELRVRTQAQVAEEVKMYKEQCAALMEKLSARGGPPPPSPSKPAKPALSPGGSVLDRMKAGVTSIAASGARSAAAEPAPSPAERR